MLRPLALIACSWAGAASAQTHHTVFADGAPSDLDTIVAAMDTADVVFLGEQHNDRVAHALQLRLLETAHEGYGDARPIVLALEMFERDVQLVLEEYLAGLIDETRFLEAARPWGAYATDYRPLVEYAKAHGLPVIAANAPDRYVNRVGREGLASLDALGPRALAFLPPLPVAAPSDALAERFREAMRGHGAHGSGGTVSEMPSIEHLLAAQNLRDATMALSVAEALARHPGALVLHVNGLFHSEGGLGIPEHLARLAPEARAFVVTMRPETDFRAAPATAAATRGASDAFRVHTDAALLPAR